MTGKISRRSVLAGGIAGGAVLVGAAAPAAADLLGPNLGPVLRVMTWNIHTAVAADNPGVIDVPRIAAVIRAEDPDVVVLNEVHQDPAGPGSHGDQPAELSALLAGAGYAHGFFGLTESDLPHEGSILPGSTNGNMILSKHPMLGEPRVVKLPNENYEPGGKDRRSLLSLTIAVPHVGEVQVHATHLSTPGSAVLVEDQKEQVQIILDHVDAEVPSVLAGDFNIRVTDVEGQDFSQNNLMQSWIARAGLSDSWRQVNDGAAGPTMTSSYGRTDGQHPDRRIDYVFTSPQLAVDSGHVSLVDKLASDHLAVVMDLRLTGRRNHVEHAVLAGEPGLDGWAQLSSVRSGEVRLSVCKNRNTSEDDGTEIRAVLRTPNGAVVRTVTDGGTSRDRCTVATWQDRLSPSSTLEVCLVQGGDVLHSRTERIDS